MTSAPLGLRDRKREETRSRLEEAAVTLVLHDGLEHATVDSISAKADVSSRTFFNYFDTKEDAILGIRDIDLTPEVVAEHLARTDGAGVVESTISLLLAVIRPSIEGAALQKSRIEVLRRYPQLFGRHVVQMTRMVDELVRAVTAILDHDSRSTAPASRAEAEVFLSLCAGAVRTAVKHWIEEGTVEPSESLHPRATALVHSLTERI
ncbi:HTH-type transcriptional regulator SrpR [Frondihabitans sp. 762G35]|uniref:TetR/AcrR family transcriptional regulator n=1 Tax=Frondihabitans sp. 762G35 TaxID=1446794 RepID=UPI000D200732|nr:TetR/AcrR family transcriptional regulator [Frondihabitans sp. 762G35]ARC57753.1 HTH-type transcriptional regulator SrpR [Frondihabitans sp. 762G35]